MAPVLPSADCLGLLGSMFEVRRSLGNRLLDLRCSCWSDRVRLSQMAVAGSHSSTVTFGWAERWSCLHWGWWSSTGQWLQWRCWCWYSRSHRKTWWEGVGSWWKGYLRWDCWRWMSLRMRRCHLREWLGLWSLGRSCRFRWNRRYRLELVLRCLWSLKCLARWINRRWHRRGLWGLRLFWNFW